MALAIAKKPRKTDVKLHVVESGIPLPTTLFRYPFKEMKVGDSFAFVPGKEITLRGCANLYSSRHEGVKFTISKAACRCWRTA